MAQDTLQYDPSSLDFGNVAIGASSSLTVTLTSAVDPDAPRNASAIVVTGAPYSVTPASTTFPTTGTERTVTVTYTPTAVGTHTGTLSITHDFGSPASPLEIPLTGTAYSPEYQLPDIENNPAGVMKITLIVDPSLPELTVPAAVSVVHIGTLTELIDVEPGVVDVQNLEIELVEDYSTYTEGFWYKVIQGYPDKVVKFKFILEEDGTDTFFFFGKVYREEVEWPEHFVATDESSVIRTVKIRLVSLIHAMRDVAIGDAIDVMIANQDGPISDSYTVQCILSSIVAAGFNQAYSTSNAVVRGCDIQFYEQDGTTVVNTVDAIIVDGSIGAYRVYIDTSQAAGISDDQQYNPHAWKFQFANPYDLLTQLCLTFGWVARYYYGQADGTYAGDATDKHYIEFLTRGTSYATTVSADAGIVQSTLLSDAATKPKNIRVTDIHADNDSISPVPPTVKYDQTTGQSWYMDGASYLSPAPGVTAIDADFEKKDPPLHAEFDLDVSTQFTLNSWYLSGGNETPTDFYYRGVHYDSGGGATICLHAAYWDYAADTPGWVQLQSYPAVLASYYARRFSSGRKQYERTYASLKFTEGGTTTHLNMKPMKRIQIDDVAASDTFYATEIRKDFETNTTTVLWIQE